MQLRFVIVLLWLAFLLSACDVNVTNTGTPTPGGYPGPGGAATPNGPYPAPSQNATPASSLNGTSMFVRPL